MMILAEGEPIRRVIISRFRNGTRCAASVLMFRYGISTRCFGVEFIWKFSALEGLVRGSTTTKKKFGLRTGRFR